MRERENIMFYEVRDKLGFIDYCDRRFDVYREGVCVLQNANPLTLADYMLQNLRNYDQAQHVTPEGERWSLVSGEMWKSGIMAFYHAIKLDMEKSLMFKKAKVNTLKRLHGNG